jgi:hypothetical protein
MSVESHSMSAAVYYRTADQESDQMNLTRPIVEGDKHDG